MSGPLAQLATANSRKAAAEKRSKENYRAALAEAEAMGEKPFSYADYMKGVAYQAARAAQPAPPADTPLTDPPADASHGEPVTTGQTGATPTVTTPETPTSE